MVGSGSNFQNFILTSWFKIPFLVVFIDQKRILLGRIRIRFFSRVGPGFFLKEGSGYNPPGSATWSRGSIASSYSKHHRGTLIKTIANLDRHAVLTCVLNITKYMLLKKNPAIFYWQLFSVLVLWWIFWFIVFVYVKVSPYSIKHVSSIQ